MRTEKRSGGRRGAPRPGAALVEVLVAAVVLVVGIGALAAGVADAARGARRARQIARGVEMLAEREARWRAAPCAARGGEAVAGGVRERWRVEVAAGEAVLTDTASLHDGRPGGAAALVWVAECAP